MFERGILQLQGRYIIQAWEPGTIGRLLASGFSLAEAMRIARANGALRRQHVIDNMIVDAGLALTAKVLIDTESVGTTWHAIGTGSSTPVAGDVKLQTEAKRIQFTSRERTAAVLTLTAFYLASESSYHIRELGVFGGAAATSTPDSGTLFSRALYDIDNSAGEDDLTFSYELTIQRG